jgi:hypothetical protein
MPTAPVIPAGGPFRRWVDNGRLRPLRPPSRFVSPPPPLPASLGPGRAQPRADTFAAEPAQDLGDLITRRRRSAPRRREWTWPLPYLLGGSATVHSVAAPALTMEWNFAHSCTCLHTPARVCTLLHDGAASGIELTSEDYFALPECCHTPRATLCYKCREVASFIQTSKVPRALKREGRFWRLEPSRPFASRDAAQTAPRSLPTSI